MPAGTRELVVSDRLVAAAKAAREYAYAPFSHFKVGAAVEDESGRIFTGCNVESASYGMTMCAERVAAFKAVSEGASKIRRVAVVTNSESITTPCGACRQVLWELSRDAVVCLANMSGKSEEHRLADLLPSPFDLEALAGPK